LVDPSDSLRKKRNLGLAPIRQTEDDARQSDALGVKIMGKSGWTLAALLMAPGAAMAQDEKGVVTNDVEITASGPQGALAGSFVDAGAGRPIALIIPGSGPTDRDGNNPAGVRAGYLKQLAQGLKASGISSVRIDKRGMFGSKAAIADPNAVTIVDYADDIHNWAQVIKARTGARCIWVIGHSEGGLVALKAAERPDDICGIVTIAAAGRPLGKVVREQFSANPANVAIADQAEAMLVALEAGRTVDVASVHPALAQLFAPAVQPYWIDVLRQDPARLAADYKGPLMIVQGSSDLQTTTQDSEALVRAQPNAHLLVLEMTHVLKRPADESRAANLATYADPSLPLAEPLVPGIASFILNNDAAAALPPS